LVSNQLFCSLLGMVGVLEFGRGDVVEVAVDPLGVIPMDPAQGSEFDVFDAAPRALIRSVDQLGFVETVDRFGECVVIRLSGQSRLGLHRFLAAGRFSWL